MVLVYLRMRVRRQTGANHAPGAARQQSELRQAAAQQRRRHEEHDQPQGAARALQCGEFVRVHREG